MPLKSPLWWTQRGAIPALLLPASVAYGVAVGLRQALIKPQRARVPVVCIGNLVAGGAGKTPVAMAVAEMFKKRGLRAFFLSRGYGGHLQGPVLVDSAQHSATDVGDEPLLLAAMAPTIIAKDRASGARFAAASGADVIIMDDGFQNPSLYKTFSLLVVDGAYGFGNGLLLPAGPLREPVAAGLQRADAVLVMNGELQAKNKPVFHATLAPDAAALKLRGQKVLAFAGLGQPEKFRATLQAIGCELVAFVPFADHHAYREQDWNNLHQQAKAAGAMLVTTAKDAVRLKAEWRAQVEVVNITAEIAEAAALEERLYEAIRHSA